MTYRSLYSVALFAGLFASACAHRPETPAEQDAREFSIIDGLTDEVPEGAPVLRKVCLAEGENAITFARMNTLGYYQQLEEGYLPAVAVARSLIGSWIAGHPELSGSVCTHRFTIKVELGSMKKIGMMEADEPWSIRGIEMRMSMPELGEGQYRGWGTSGGPMIDSRVLRVLEGGLRRFQSVRYYQPSGSLDPGL